VLLILIFLGSPPGTAAGDRRPSVEVPIQDRIFDVTSFGATGAGTVDDCAPIQTALDAAERAGGGVVYLPAGTYVVGGQLEIGDRTALVGEGEASILRTTPEARITILRNRRPYIGGNNEILIRNLAFIGGGKRSEYVAYEQLVWLTRVTSATIEGVTFRDSRNDGLVLEYCKDVTARGNRAMSNSKVGIYVSGSDYVTVTGNELRDNALIGIGVAASWYCAISRNVAVDNAMAGISSGRDTQFTSFLENVIDAFDVSPEPIGSLPFASEHGTSPDRYKNGRAHGISHCQIAGNRITSPAGRNVNGLRLILGEKNVIEGNAIVGAWGHGIMLHGSSENTVRYNSISNCGNGDRGTMNPSSSRIGVFVVPLDASHSASGNLVEANVLFNSGEETQFGIQISRNSADCVVRNNTILVRERPLIDDGSNTVVSENFCPACPSSAELPRR
jgi:parallel beta-helix repeat protein